MNRIVGAIFVLCVALQLAYADVPTALPTGVVFDNGAFKAGYGIVNASAAASAAVLFFGAQQVIVGTVQSADNNTKAAASAAANALAAGTTFANAAADAAAKWAAALKATGDASAAATLLVTLAAAGEANSSAQAYYAAAVDAVQKSIVAQAAIAEAQIAGQAAASAGAQFQTFINVIITLAPGAAQICAPIINYAGGALTPGNTYTVFAVVESGLVIVASVDLTGYANTAVTAAQAALAATASQPTSVFATFANSAALSAQVVQQVTVTVSNAANTAAADAVAASVYVQGVYNALDASIFAAFGFVVKSSTPYTTAVFRYYKFYVSTDKTGVISFNLGGGSPQTLNVSPVVQVVTVPIASFGAVGAVLDNLSFVVISTDPLSVRVSNVQFI